MTTSYVTIVRSTKRKRPIGTDQTLIYRGIKIAPIKGKRSPVAEYIRDALLANAARQRGHDQS